MELQEKFLNKQYLETRLRERNEIKRKEFLFDIEESNRVFSKSLYINIYNQSTGGKKFKSHTLRISDHPLENCPHSQFIIEPNSILTKKKKTQFVRALETAFKKAEIKHFYKELKEISKEDIINE